MADYIRAEVRAANIARSAADLASTITHASYTADGGGAHVFAVRVLEAVQYIRDQLAQVEEALGLTEAAPETEAA